MHFAIQNNRILDQIYYLMVFVPLKTQRCVLLLSFSEKFHSTSVLITNSKSLLKISITHFTKHFTHFTQTFYQRIDFSICRATKSQIVRNWLCHFLQLWLLCFFHTFQPFIKQYGYANTPPMPINDAITQ